jgi:hypothetical protein
MLKDPKAREVFQSLAKIEVGDGRKVLFWSDRWINGFTASDHGSGTHQEKKQQNGFCSGHWTTAG